MQTAVFVLTIGAFVTLALGFAWLGNSARDQVTKHPLRRRLLDMVRRRPGVRMAEIWQTLEANRGTAKYHLLILERANAVEAVRTKRITRYFPSGVGPDERSLLALLLRGRVMELVRAITRNPGFSQRELTGSLAMSRKVFRRYVDLLIESRLLNEIHEPHLRRYYPTHRLDDALQRIAKRENTREVAETPEGPPGGPP